MGVEEDVEALLRGRAGRDDGESGAVRHAELVADGEPVPVGLAARRRRGDRPAPCGGARAVHPVDEVGRDPEHQGAAASDDPLEAGVDDTGERAPMARRCGA